MELDTSQEQRELILLEQIEEDPDITQASLADKLDVAVGTVNWHIKRMVNKGYIKLKRAERKKLRYIITPEGISFRAQLTVKYIENSMLLFRRTRNRVTRLLSDVRDSGFESIRITGDGDLAEVIRLTCIEQGIKIDRDPELPALEVRGWKVFLMMNGEV
ncbi:MAG: winged helix-turn-helix transcriptional regulator [Anaerolineales bacterium]|nr:winged helix-turn-helix transcriptional regulator [Chloroflexota bacterium]MBL6979884.1 winged helix-turn-helix transcriptional regulator [Anaerolineales bacterium]